MSLSSRSYDFTEARASATLQVNLSPVLSLANTENVQGVWGLETHKKKPSLFLREAGHCILESVRDY